MNNQSTESIDIQTLKDAPDNMTIKELLNSKSIPTTSNRQVKITEIPAGTSIGIYDTETKKITLPDWLLKIVEAKSNNDI